MAKPAKIDETEEIHNPVERFAHLPEPTRKFLEDLREDDITDLNDAVRFYRNAKTIGRFNAWLIMSALATFGAFVAFGEAIRKILGWTSPGGHP